MTSDPNNNTVTPHCRIEALAFQATPAHNCIKSVTVEFIK